MIYDTKVTVLITIDYYIYRNKDPHWKTAPLFLFWWQLKIVYSPPL